MNTFMETYKIPIIVLFILLCIALIVFIIERLKHYKYIVKQETELKKPKHEDSKYLPEYRVAPITESTIKWTALDIGKITNECSTIIKTHPSPKAKPLLNTDLYTFTLPKTPVIQNEETLQHYLHELSELKTLVSSIHDKTVIEKQGIDDERARYYKIFGPVFEAETQIYELMKRKKAEFDLHKESLKQDIVDYKSKIDNAYKEIEDYKIELQHTYEKQDLDIKAMDEIYRSLGKYKGERTKDADIVRQKLKNIDANHADYVQAIEKQESVLSSIEDKIMAAEAQLDKIKSIKEVEVLKEVVEIPMGEETIIVDTPEITTETVISTEPKTEREIMDEIRAGWKKESEEKEQIEEHRRKFKEEQKLKQQEAEKKKKAMREENYNHNFK